MTTLLQQAIDLAQKGQRQDAEALLRLVVAEQPKNEAAWMWFSAVTQDVEEKQQALEQALAVNPANALAQKGLTRFRQVAAARAPVETPPAETPVVDDGLPWLAPDSAAPSPPAESAAPAFEFVLDADADHAEAAPLPVGDSPDEAPAFSFEFDAGESDQALAQPEEAPAFEGFDLDDESPADFDFDFDFDSDFKPSEIAADSEPDEIAPLEPPITFTPDAPPAPSKPSVAPLAFDFDDEAPVAKQPEAPAEADEDAFDFFADFLSEAEESPADDSFSWDEQAMGADDLSARLDFTDTPVEDIEENASAEIFDDPLEDEAAQKADKLSPEEAMRLGKQRQQKQTKILIIGTAVFALTVILCIGLYYYLAEISDVYTLIPQLAGPELTEYAAKPKDGVSLVNFQGYPASRAKIEWKEAPDAPTCSGSIGLEVDFGNGDPASRLSNRLCSEGSCVYEKDITPAAIRKVTVTYLCGRSAAITLYHQQEGDGQ